MTRYPPDWQVVELGKIGTWLSGGTPSTSNPAYWDGDIPWISAASLKSFDIRDSERNVTELGSSSGTRRVPANTVLFIVRGMSLKSEFRVGITSREVTFGQDCKAIIVPSGIQSRFLAYALKARETEILAMVDEAGHGTGRLPSDQLGKLRIGIPSEREQVAILSTLDSIDESIHSVEHLIAKWNQAKKGLLQKFITDDIHREGHVELGSCLIEIEAGRSPDVPDHPAGPGDWGVLKVSAVRSWGFDAAENKAVTISSMVNPKYEVRDGDLLITRANTPQLVGAACFVDHPPGRLLLSDKTLRLVVDKRKLNARFASYVLASPGVRRQIEVSGTGTSGSMKNISQSDILALQFHLPGIETQERIVESVESTNSLIAQYRAEITKLWQIKRGLMNDLPTGRRRVT